MKCQINQSLLKLKLLYFSELSVISCLFIYLTLFLNEWGLTASELGVINFTANIVAFFFRPFIGYVADKYQKFKELIIVISVLCCIVYSIHLASPKYVGTVTGYSLKSNYKISNVITNRAVSICSKSPSGVIVHWPKFLEHCDYDIQQMVFNKLNNSCAIYNILRANKSETNIQSSFHCRLLSPNFTESSLAMVPFIRKTYNSGLTWSSAFWTLGILKSIGFSLFSCLISLTDAITFVTLGKENAHRFGFTRMFGTIGVLLFSIISGLLLQGMDQLAFLEPTGWASVMMAFSRYIPCFCLAVLMFVCVIVIALFLPTNDRIHTAFILKNDSVLKKFLHLTSFNVLCRSWEIGVFFIFSVFGGFLLHIFLEYYFLIIFQMFPDLPKYFPGLLTAIMTLSESIFFGLSSRILKYISYESCVSFAFFAWGMRWLSYAFVKNYWWLLLCETLQGPAFGLMLPALMFHISRFGTISTQGRMQGLFSGFFFNIGGAFGGLFGGIILEYLNFRGLFIIMCAMSLICSVCYYSIQKFIVLKICHNEEEMTVNPVDNDALLAPVELTDANNNNNSI